MCPICKSENVNVGYVEYHREAEIGYEESWVPVRCLACGYRGNTDDLFDVIPEDAQVAA